MPVYLDEIGKSGAFESVTVTPQVAGRITERLFEDGAELKKDQLLFTIDPRPIRRSWMLRRRNWRRAKAALDLANTQLKMYASIADTRAVSQLDFETKKNTVAWTRRRCRRPKPRWKTPSSISSIATSTRRSTAAPARAWWTWATWCRPTPPGCF